MGLGFRAIGCGVALSTASALLINGFLAPKTKPPVRSLFLIFILFCPLDKLVLFLFHGEESLFPKNSIEME